MATIKAYTDITQSKRLAEILPLESADMLLGYYYNGKDYCVPNIRPFRDMHNNIPKGYTPAWSLAALLDILSKTAYTIDEDGSVDLCDYKNIEWSLGLTNTNVGLFTANNPVDACVEVIIKLNELNLL